MRPPLILYPGPFGHTFAMRLPPEVVQDKDWIHEGAASFPSALLLLHDWSTLGFLCIPYNEDFHFPHHFTLDCKTTAAHLEPIYASGATTASSFSGLGFLKRYAESLNAVSFSHV